MPISKLVVTIPGRLPLEASPNWRGHWAQQYRAKAAFKRAAFLYATDAVNRAGASRPVFERARCSVAIIIPRSHYRRDPDNAIASLKAAIDGCVVAGVIPDDSSVYLDGPLPPTWIVDPAREPEITLEFSECV